MPSQLFFPYDETSFTVFESLDANLLGLLYQPPEGIAGQFAGTESLELFRRTWYLSLRGCHSRPSDGGVTFLGQKRVYIQRQGFG